MDRRRLLIALSSGSLSLSGSWATRLAARTKARADPQDSVVIGLADLVTDPDAAREIGWRYLTQYADALERFDNVVQIASREHHTVEDLLRDLNAQKKRDFLRGQTVVLDGWVLSRTEVGVCVLLGLA